MKLKFILIPLCVLLLIFWLYIPEYIFPSRLIIYYHHDIRKRIRVAHEKYYDFDRSFLNSHWKDSDGEKIIKSGFLNSKDNKLRRHAIHALGYIEGYSIKYVPIIINAFSDTDIAYPEYSLRRYQDKALPYLKAALKSKNPLVRERACNALRFVNKEKAYPLLREILLTDPDKFTKSAAAWTLCEDIGNPEIIKDLLSVIRNEDEARMKDRYLHKLALLKSPDTINAFLELIKENELPVKFKLSEETAFDKMDGYKAQLPRYKGELPLNTQNELKLLLKNEIFSKWAREILSQCGYTHLIK